MKETVSPHSVPFTVEELNQIISWLAEIPYKYSKHIIEDLQNKYQQELKKLQPIRDTKNVNS